MESDRQITYNDLRFILLPALMADDLTIGSPQLDKKTLIGSNQTIEEMGYTLCSNMGANRVSDNAECR